MSHPLRNDELINCVFMRRYFFFIQGEKRRDSLAITFR